VNGIFNLVTPTGSGSGKSSSGGGGGGSGGVFGSIARLLDSPNTTTSSSSSNRSSPSVVHLSPGGASSIPRSHSPRGHSPSRERDSYRCGHKSSTLEYFLYSWR
jgi:hypothetical protein